MNKEQFQDFIWQKGRELYRNMPWRRDTRPYFVLVSELMLQQTQVERVVPKFEAFIAAFPDEKRLASASLAKVLTLWSGLGYNRRAKFLHEAAKHITQHGSFPDTREELMQLSGVGPNTAGAILAYAFNQPVVFVETNIRTVYFHHFFTNGEKISDKEVATKMVETMDFEHPRQFYWALMDYGTYLKKQGAGKIVQSKHYKKQPPLKGSVREVRGLILKQLASGEIARSHLEKLFENDARLDPALSGLLRDGLVTCVGERLHLTK